MSGYRTLSLLRAGLVVFCFILVSSCSGPSTIFTDTWKDPNATPLHFKKVLVIVIHPEEIIRRSAEDNLVRSITRTEAIAGHTILSQEDIKDVEKAKSKVKEQGIDGAVVMRLVKVDEQQHYVEGRVSNDPAYGYWGTTYGFWGYYGSYYPVIYEPGYSVSKEYLIIETNIYSVKDDKLIWSGLSRTPRLDSMRELMNDIGAAAAEQLKKEGLIG